MGPSLVVEEGGTTNIIGGLTRRTKTEQRGSDQIGSSVSLGQCRLQSL